MYTEKDEMCIRDRFKSGLGIFLSIHRHLAAIAMMALHKLHRLHKHTARTATRVVDFTFIGFNHFGNQIDYRFGRIKFPLTFSFFNGKLGKEILIDTSNNIIAVCGLDVYKRQVFNSVRSELPQECPMI